MTEHNATSLSPTKVALVCGLAGGLLLVVLAQNLSHEVEGSMTLTLITIAVGFALGAGLGFFVKKKAS
ncbi:MAG: hypothetical protein AAFS10_06780 [Myxococcota bacterium]